MSDSCDPGPAQSIYAKVYELAAELREKAAARIDLLKRASAKMPQVDPQTDPLQSVPVKQAIRDAHVQGMYRGKNEAYREVASLLQGIDQQNQVAFSSAKPHLQTLLQRQLKTYEQEARDPAETEERKVIHPMVFTRQETESLPAFFKRAFATFEQIRKCEPASMELPEVHEMLARGLTEAPIKIIINFQLRENQMKLW